MGYFFGMANKLRIRPARNTGLLARYHRVRVRKTRTPHKYTKLEMIKIDASWTQQSYIHSSYAGIFDGKRKDSERHLPKLIQPAMSERKPWLIYQVQ